MIASDPRIAYSSSQTVDIQRNDAVCSLIQISRLEFENIPQGVDNVSSTVAIRIADSILMDLWFDSFDVRFVVCCPL